MISASNLFKHSSSNCVFWFYSTKYLFLLIKNCRCCMQIENSLRFSFSPCRMLLKNEYCFGYIYSILKSDLFAKLLLRSRLNVKRMILKSVNFSFLLSKTLLLKLTVAEINIMRRSLLNRIPLSFTILYNFSTALRNLIWRYSS